MVSFLLASISLQIVFVLGEEVAVPSRREDLGCVSNVAAVYHWVLQEQQKLLSERNLLATDIHSLARRREGMLSGISKNRNVFRFEWQAYLVALERNPLGLGHTKS